MIENTLPTEPFTYRLGEVVSDSNDFNSYHFHLPRGTLEKRMSALELCQVLGPHLLGVLPVLGTFESDPTVYAEFAAMVTLLYSNPQAAVDRVLPWIKSVTRTGDDDIVCLSLGDIGKPVLAGTVFSIAGVSP